MTGKEDMPLGGNHGPRFMELVNRLIELDAERAAIAGRIKAAEAEAKADNFDVKAMRQAIKLITGTGDIAATEDHRSAVGMYIATIAERITSEPPVLDLEKVDDSETIARWQQRAAEILETGVR